MSGEVLLWGLVGLAAVCGGAALVSQLRPAAKLRRRLRKSHGRVFSKGHQPMVKFSVRPPRK